MSRRVREYRADGIVVTFEAALCIHSERCVHGLPRVFDPRARPWIRPENASPGEVAGAVAHCPTGALRYERLDGGAPEPVPARATVTVARDGALLVTGDVRVVDEEGGVFTDRPRCALCRCGHSANRPFCDGTHARIGFRG